MTTKPPLLLASLLIGSIVLCSVQSALASAAYDLSKVQGIETFEGSAAAKEILARNGFVVADPAFKQIFEAYIKSPETKAPSSTNWQRESLPSFITTDSAWHTYHVLLEEGVKHVEEIQSERLRRFSRRLLTAAQNRTWSNTRDRDDLILFVSVGLAMQDETYRQSLGPEARRIVESLRAGSTPVAAPIGFELSPLVFRAQSFYTQSPELSDYFAARQWYASVVFRLANPRETRLAVALSQLVYSDTELSPLWRQLSDLFDTFLAPVEDGTVGDYAEKASEALGVNFNPTSLSDPQMNEVQKLLDRRVGPPRVNDQMLSPEQYAAFSAETRGFRVLPPRRLPCAVCFHNTTDPKISGRMYPSGLDFMAASPVLRSPAAERALQSQFGKKTSDLILRADCGGMPLSLHGDAMQLLSLLQKPLPSTVPAALRTEAWSDLQLWTQLAAWAEQRHTWALHTKLSVLYMGIISPPKGIVAPYPDFFSGLAKLTRRTADAFANAGLEPTFEIKTAAMDLLAAIELSASARTENLREQDKNSNKLNQLAEFENRYFVKHRAELEKDKTGKAYEKMIQDLAGLARRCAASGQATADETETLRMFFDSRQNISRLLNDFAPVCDRLAELAKKSLTGQPLTDEDAAWIESYGVTLAGFHFYYGNSYEVPRDDFPIVTHVFSNPLMDSMLYAGLARPQSLYLIVPNGNTTQLYRGAVMTYREFVRPNDQLLDDESWRELISRGQTPPAPPFTRSFYAETSVAELLKKLRAQGRNEYVNYGDLGELLWQIGSRATEKDLPELMDVLTSATGEGQGDLVTGIADIIAALPWESRQKQLINLLTADAMIADAAARILTERPAALDTAALISGFDRQPTRTRRLYCAILGYVPLPTDAVCERLVKALHDHEDGVRWQAASAMANTNAHPPQFKTALVESLNDPNEFVGAAAAHSLAKLGVAEAAPALLAKLKTRTQATNLPPEDRKRQVEAIRRDIHEDFNRPYRYRILDPAHLDIFLRETVPDQVKERASLRLPPDPIGRSAYAYDLTDALIDALGDLKHQPAADELFKFRSTDHNTWATRALSQIVPDRLTKDLLAIAKDTQVDSYLREKALADLCRISATNCVRDLVPLLDDVTPIVYSRSFGQEWRICDRTAVTIAILLQWESPMASWFVRPQQQAELIARAKEWAKP